MKKGCLYQLKTLFLKHKVYNILLLVLLLSAAGTSTQLAKETTAHQATQLKLEQLTTQVKKLQEEKDELVKEKDALQEKVDKGKASHLDILSFKKEKQLVLGELDSHKRATFAHIQLRAKDKATTQRQEKITVDPAGWHNYEFWYGDGKQKAWLMNRGHLIGHQFSGLNDELKNLTPLTAWVNMGDYNQPNDSNDAGMLYYENRLSEWLDKHPDYYLDYKVTPIYTGAELIPRKMTLHYVGIDSNGDVVPIKLGGKDTTDDKGMTTVTLENTAGNAKINYLDGTAENTVQEFKEEAVTTTEQESEVVQDRIVYIARNGTSDVYWYNMANMPANTNRSKVVTMTESEAIRLGKRHTVKE